jgi:hypothetical protein
MKLTAAQHEQLKRDMVVVFQYFRLSPEVAKVARESALHRTTAAYRCYRSIVRSL